MYEQSCMVSVVIPVYNTENYIERCLNSILNNTYQNIEVICVDDGSVDNSNEILQRIALCDSRVHVISQSNNGVSSARNAGILAAKGEFITFIDSDDWIHPKYFELLLQCQYEHDANVVICSVKDSSMQEVYPEISYNEKSIRCLNLEKFMFESHVRVHVIAHMYKRDVLEGHKFPQSLRIGEDTAFNTEVVCEVDNLKLYVMDENLYYYFQREDSAVHTIRQSEIIHLSEWYIEHMDNVREEVQKLYLEKAFNTIFSYRYLEMFSSDYAEKK